MYSQEDREWALYVYSELGSLRAAQRETGVSAASIARWAASAGRPRPPRKEPVYLPLERKLELVARLEAGERADDLGREAGVSGGAVYRWRRRLREEGVTSLMTDDDARAAAPEPAGPPSELEELRARCEELELRNAVLEGTIEILNVNVNLSFTDSVNGPLPFAPTHMRRSRQPHPPLSASRSGARSLVR